MTKRKKKSDEHIPVLEEGDVLICEHDEKLVLVCCDCDLVHVYEVSVDGADKRVCLRVKVDRKETARLRRKDKIRVTRG